MQRLHGRRVRGARLDLADGGVGEVDVRILERALADHAAAGELDLAHLRAADDHAAVGPDLDRRGIRARGQLDRRGERLSGGRHDLGGGVELEGAVAGLSPAGVAAFAALAMAITPAPMRPADAEPADAKGKSKGKSKKK